MSAPVIFKPHPHCLVPIGHPCYRGYVPAEHTDIAATFERYTPPVGDIRDDYALVEQQDWLSAPGGFRG